MTGNTPPPGPLRQQPPGSSRKKLLTHSAAAAGGLFVGVLIGIVGSSGDNSAKLSSATTVTETITATATQTMPAAASGTTTRAPSNAGGAATIPGEGTFQVGDEVKPGTYRTDGPANSGASDTCYWERAKNASGEPESIISNGITAGPARVDIKEGEIFKSQGCQEWKLVT